MNTFAKTMLGRKFIEGQIPKLIKELLKLNNNLVTLNQNLENLNSQIENQTDMDTKLVNTVDQMFKSLPSPFEAALAIEESKSSHNS